MYPFTKFIVFVTAPCLFTNTILLEHAYLYQCTMHCPPLAFVCLAPCTFRFPVLHRLLRNHIPPLCGVVPSRHYTIGDGFSGHKTVNTKWWFVYTTQVYHWGRGGFNTGFSPLHCEMWMWNIKILMGPLGQKIQCSPKQGLRQPF